MAISEQWLAWTRENLKNGATAIETHKVLRDEGFTPKDIKYALKKAMPKDTYKNAVQAIFSEVNPKSGAQTVDYHALANPALVRNAKRGGVQTLCDDEMQLFCIPNFLKVDQCNTLIEIIQSNAHISKVDGYETQSGIRSSRTCSLAAHLHPNITEINNAISQALGINPGWSEVTQGQWYEPTQEYKPHPDYFPLDTPEYRRFAQSQGQRTWTFMIYLNDTVEGGGTHFTKIDTTVMPEQGKAVCWNNLLVSGQPNVNTEHAGLPVVQGSKFIITKWFRDQGKGPALIA